MARPLRIEYEGALYHITSRGDGKKAIFIQDADKKLFLDILTDINEKYNLICHAYCLMENHYHLLIETLEGNLSKAMRGLNGVYTQKLNRVHNRVGHVFQGRYKAILVQKESYLLELARYIALNPVRAKITKSAADYTYSSHQGTAGLVKPDSCLTTDWILSSFAKTKKSAQSSYRRFIEEGLDKGPFKLKNQIILGDPDFTQQIVKYIKPRKLLEEIPRSQRYLDRPALNIIFDTAKDKENRDRLIKESVYKWGYTQKAIADHLSLHYSTLSKLVNSK